MKFSILTLSLFVTASISFGNDQFSNVEFLNPIDGEVLDFPTQARNDFLQIGDGAKGYAFDPSFIQTQANDRVATVVNVLGNEEGRVNELMGVHLRGQGNGEKLDRDFFMNISGGNFSLVSAGLVADNVKNNCAVKGDLLTQVGGNAQVNTIIGVGDEGGPFQGKLPTFEGNAGIVVKDSAVVLGSIVGGWTSKHDLTPQVKGGTAILIQNVQGTNAEYSAVDKLPAGYICGGCMRLWNKSVANIYSNTSVTVDIPFEGQDTPTNFVKTIIGGTWGTPKSGTSFWMGGSSYVSITAPTNVIFDRLIVAGGLNQGGGAVIQKGEAVLNLKGGTFSGPLQGGIANKGKSLNFSGTNILLSTLSVTDFDSVSFKTGSLTSLHGTVSLPACSFESGAELDLSAEESALSVTGQLAIPSGEKVMIRTGKRRFSNSWRGGVPLIGWETPPEGEIVSDSAYLQTLKKEEGLFLIPNGTLLLLR